MEELWDFICYYYRWHCVIDCYSVLEGDGPTTYVLTAIVFVGVEVIQLSFRSALNVPIRQSSVLEVYV